MKLALGTVQFGLRYGAFNTKGQVIAEEAATILDAAYSGGITVLDTARSYGDSELVLGEAAAPDRFNIVTKIPSLSHSLDEETDIDEAIAQSCQALGVGHLETLLFHDCADLIGKKGDANWAIASRAQREGLVGRLGVSVYDPEHAELIADRYTVAVVQLPVSIFDQRAISSGALARLKANGIELHARSAFLQGFAMADPNTLSGSLVRHQDALIKFRKFAQDHAITPAAAALSFVMMTEELDHVVVGVLSADELAELIAIAKEPHVLSGAQSIASEDLQLLNPALWQNV